MDTQKNLTDLVRDKAGELGADACKIADLSRAKEYITAEYGDFCATFPRAVSIAVFFPKEILKQQKDGPTRTYNYFYNVINRQLDSISLAVSTLLQKAGHRAYPIPASDYREDGRALGLQYRVLEEENPPDKTETELYGMFGHRLAASLSGIGWVGKSCSIINPQVGPYLRLVTVLTDAPLSPDEPIQNRCGSCTRCRDACPAGALTGVAFDPGQSVEDRIIRTRCQAHMAKIKEYFGQGTCALCLSVCPWGRQPDKNTLQNI